MQRIKRHDRVLTACEGGYVLKPAPADGWLIAGARFVSDEEAIEITKLIAAEQGVDVECLQPESR